MRATLTHLVLSTLGGILLAAVLALPALALDAPAWAVGLAVGIGVVCAGTAGGCVSLLCRREARPLQQQVARLKSERDTLETRLSFKPAPRIRKRRRRPFRPPLRARVSAALRWVKISKSLQRLLRPQGEELAGKPIYHTLHPEDVPVLDKALEEAQATRQARQVVCRFIVPDPATAEKAQTKPGSQSDTKMLPPLKPQSFVHLRLEVRARFDAQGKLRHYHCWFVDLTEAMALKELEVYRMRKEASRARKRLRTTLQDLARLKLSYVELYHNSPVMYFSINREGKLVTFNDKLVRMLGYERTELKGKKFADLLAPAGEKNHLAGTQDLPWQEGEFETRWRRKDGTLIDVWIHSLLKYDEDGPARLRSAALDLTEKNRLANELRSRGDELERMNQRLRVINTELEDFTHVVSHDLKEPLRTLQAYSNILHEEHAAQLGPDGFQYINHLIRASKRLGRLIDELLQLSQAGRIRHVQGVFNLGEIVATVRQDLVDLLQRKQASLIREGALPDLVGDPVRITQLLSNLVANGLKYNENAAPQVVIGAKSCADDPAWVTIYVRDNGIGIDPAYHQQIFGIFRRLHQSDEYEGTGAGLAICKKIVEGHGGRIWVESQPGQGATFYFTLPAPPADRAALNGAPEPVHEPSSPSSATRRLSGLAAEALSAGSPRIVLVDDQQEVGMIIKKLGQRDGLSITWFPTAEEAWNHLQAEPADLLLFDVNLPGMSGVELCQRIRTLAHLQHTPVAIFTPEQEPEHLQALRDAGADFFLTKDLLCQPAVWQQRMQELLEEIRQPRFFDKVTR